VKQFDDASTEIVFEHSHSLRFLKKLLCLHGYFHPAECLIQANQIRGCIALALHRLVF
jgi:hypothetical protein